MISANFGVKALQGSCNLQPGKSSASFGRTATLITLFEPLKGALALLLKGNPSLS